MTAPTRQNRKPKTTGPPGFTLIELLVVVCIIGLLAALVVSSIRSVLHNASSVKCQSNLRQLGTAVHLYMTDHNNELPPHSDQSTPSWTLWQSYIHPYIPDQFQGNVKRASMYCPEIEQTKTNYAYTGYAFNANFYLNDVKNKVFVPTRVNGQFQNSKLVLVWEDVQKLNFDGGFPSSTYGGSWYEFAFRHAGKCHLLLLDGHVEAIPKKGDLSAKQYPEYLWGP